ncbi:MAG: T9SS type A sorting domain-containing protein, partial [Bacteroidia bacterium]|nr:T9SS type A sorting domain-containing protein [Bacteroidia bacterium]
EVDSILPTEYPDYCNGNQRLANPSSDNSTQKEIMEEEKIQEGFSMRLYPNPVNDFITIQVNEQSQYEIFNQFGVVLKAGEVNKNTTKLSVNELPVGIYWVRILSSQGNYAFQSFQIIR